MCEADVPDWKDVCLSCAANDQSIGCPAFDSTAQLLKGHGLFLAWVDAKPPPIAFNSGFAGGTPAPSNGIPPLSDAIRPADCTMVSYAVSRDKTNLVISLGHEATSLVFHINASLNPGYDGALNLSLAVELLPTGAPAPASARPSTIMTAFPYITGLALRNVNSNGTSDGTSNRGINHFSTGLATDGLVLPGWDASGGLHGWHTGQAWSAVWEPSTGNGAYKTYAYDAIH